MRRPILFVIAIALLAMAHVSHAAESKTEAAVAAKARKPTRRGHGKAIDPVLEFIRSMLSRDIDSPYFASRAADLRRLRNAIAKANGTNRPSPQHGAIAALEALSIYLEVTNAYLRLYSEMPWEGNGLIAAILYQRTMTFLHNLPSITHKPTLGWEPAVADFFGNVSEYFWFTSHLLNNAPQDMDELLGIAINMLAPAKDLPLGSVEGRKIVLGLTRFASMSDGPVGLTWSLKVWHDMSVVKEKDFRSFRRASFAATAELANAHFMGREGVLPQNREQAMRYVWKFLTGHYCKESLSELKIPQQVKTNIGWIFEEAKVNPEIEKYLHSVLVIFIDPEMGVKFFDKSVYDFVVEQGIRHGFLVRIGA